LYGVSFELTNTGLEKFWNYEDSNLIVTYEALIGGVKTNVTETQSYFSGSNISMDCDGSNGGDIPPGTWSISQITGDILDPGLLNSDETADVVTQLSYPLSNTISTISMTFASDIGKTTTASFETSSNCVWENPSWLDRKLITIDYTKVSDDLSNFPVLISIVDSDLQANVQADGDDIFFTSDDKITKLNHEIEEYDNSDGTLVAWVNIPSLSSSVDTEIYMYFGNSLASNQENAQNVWDDDYIMIQHLNETSGTHIDSTQYGNSGTIRGNTDQTVSGIISGADEFDGSNSGIDISSSSSLDTLDHMTTEAWFFADNISSNEVIATFFRDTNDRTYLWYDDPGAGFRVWEDINNSNDFEATTSFTPTNEVWYHIAWTIDGTDWKIYINGVEQGSTSDSLTMFDLGDGFTTVIGERWNGSQGDRTWNGVLDEVRISDIARSPDWLLTQYNNQFSPGTFYAVGPNEEFADWYDGNWQYRKTIAISNAQVPEYQTDFPVLINFTDSNLRDFADADGGDIVFTSSDGRTQLDHEIEYYDTSDGTLVAWVKVPNLYAFSDTTLYMYYGHNVIGNQENPTGVWTNGYEAVYHLNDDFEDSTSNNYDATNSGSSDIVGLLADAQDFEGRDNSDHLDLGTWNVNGDDLTIQTWAKFESFVESSRLLSKAQSPTSTENHVYALAVDTSGLPYFYLKSCGAESCTTSVLSDSDSLQSESWNLVTATYDGSSMRLFVNGTQVAISSESGNIRQNSWSIYAGNNPTALDREFDGILDEIRISSNARSGNWLTAEYNNQVSSETFYSLGVPEQFGFT